MQPTAEVPIKLSGPPTSVRQAALRTRLALLNQLLHQAFCIGPGCQFQMGTVN